MNGTWFGNLHVDHESDADPQVVAETAAHLQLLADLMALPSERSYIVKFETERDAFNYAAKHDMQVIEQVMTARGSRLNVVTPEGQALTLSSPHPAEPEALQGDQPTV